MFALFHSQLNVYIRRSLFLSCCGHFAFSEFIATVEKNKHETVTPAKIQLKKKNTTYAWMIGI